MEKHFREFQEPGSQSFKTTLGSTQSGIKKSVF